MDPNTVPGTAPVSAPPPSAPPAQGPGPQSQSTTTDQSLETNDLREKFKQAFGKSLSAGSSVFSDVAKTDGVPDSIAAQPPAQPEPGQVDTGPAAAQIPNPAAEPAVAPEPPAQPEQPQEAPAAVRLNKFGRDFSLNELEAAVEAANYYHPKALKLQEDVQRLAAEKAQVQQLRSAPELVLVDAIRSNPNLKAEVLQIVSKYDQATAGQYQQAQPNPEVAKLQEQVRQMQAIEAQRRQEFVQQKYAETVQTVDNATSQMLGVLSSEGIEISQDDLKALTDSAVALVQSGRMQFSAQNLIGFFERELGRVRAQAHAVRNRAVNGYVEQKRSAPPPPPTGGASQPLAVPTPRDWGEIKQTMSHRIEQALNQL
jgi:hypothetical protein